MFIKKGINNLQFNLRIYFELLLCMSIYRLDPILIVFIKDLNFLNLRLQNMTSININPIHTAVIVSAAISTTFIGECKI